MARYYYWDKKDTIEGTLGADLVAAKHLIKNGWASITTTQRPSGSNIGWRVDFEDAKVWFNYISTDKQTGEKTEHYYSRDLIFTDCNFGGKRPWFVCPCGREVKALYIGGSDTKAYCRHCLKLTYQTTREPNYSRAEFRLLKNQYDFDEAIEKLNLKTKYYNGKPTRRYKKYLALERKYGGRMSDAKLYLLEKRLLKV